MRNKHNILFFFFIIGIPNFFVQYDQTALTYNSALDINMIFRIAIVLFSFSYVGFYLLKRASFSSRYFQAIKIPLLYYIVFLIISCFTLNFQVSSKVLFRIIEWITFFGIIYLIQQSRNRLFLIEDFINILYKLIYIVLLIILFGILFFTDMAIITSPVTNVSRIGGYLISPNIFGVLLSVMICLVYLDNTHKFKIFKLIILFVLLLLTYSRGAMISLFLSFFLVMLLHSKNSMYYVISSLILLIIISFNSEFLLTIFNRGMGIESLYMLSERTLVWQSTYDLFLEKMFFGYGFLESKIIGLQLRDYYNIHHFSATHAHNDFLQALLAGGLVMFIFTVYFYLSLFNIKRKLINNLNIIRIIFFILFISSLQRPLISFNFAILPAIFWLLYIALINEKHEDTNSTQ